MFESGSKFDKYTIEGHLGRGGMGSVYVATNPFGVRVVLKLLRPEFARDKIVAERFRREGRIQYTLRHPNIVRVTDIIEHQGVPALVIDYMEGLDLDRLLEKRGGGLLTSELLRYALPLLDALELAHSNGFIHRDLKPGNIFLEEDGKGGYEPRLLDFGIAKVESEAGGLTRADEFAGTPAYTSPEQIMSTRDVSHHSDIYSFGVLLWAMCTGHEPWREIGDDPHAVLGKVLHEPLPDLPATVPEWLRDIIGTATAKRPQERFQSAAAFRDALSHAARKDNYGDSIRDFTAVGGDGAWASGFNLFDEGIPGSSTPLEASPLPQAPSLPPGGHTPTMAPLVSGLISNAEAVRDAHAALYDEVPMDSGPELAERPVTGDRLRQIEQSFKKAPQSSASRTPLLIALLLALVVAAIAAFFFWPRSIATPPGFVRVAAGSYTIGSPASELGRREDERQRSVTISRPFAVATTEVTMGEWEALMFTSPGAFADCGANCPITNITWLDAVRYANQRSIKEGLRPCYQIEGTRVSWPDGTDCQGYRLLTEAEWEVAARAGDAHAVPGGDLARIGRDGPDPALDAIAWYGANSDASYNGASNCSSWGQDRTRCGIHPVGSRQANAWGIHDMHGNVAEWVWDVYSANPDTEARDPTGPDEGSQRVIRGGSWRDSAERCRSAARERSAWIDRDYLGFRLARTLR